MVRDQIRGEGLVIEKVRSALFVTALAAIKRCHMDTALIVV